jgi:CoA:oxalate CoA-transferase
MTMTACLQGITVLDLTRVLAGPYCTMMLADLGAEVIKVERPGTGDDSRSFGPFVNGESAYFMSINRGKRSVTLNLKSPEGKDILRRLASEADILVENFKPGVMAKLGLSYEQLKEANPRLIYAASSGFGQTGPYSRRPAYDLIIQGMGGLMSITGHDEAHPTKVGSSIADIFAGVFCCIGILGGLFHREKTGHGQMVDVGMLDCMVAILENAISRFVVSGKSPPPMGNRHPSIAPFTTFPTADGKINIACGNDDLWVKFCQLIGRPGLAGEKHYSSNQDRVHHWDTLEPQIAEAMQAKTTSAWLSLLQEGQIPCGPIHSIAEVMSDPHVQFREMILELVHPIAGKLKVPGSPIKLSETPVHITQAAPVLGGDNHAIYVERLKYSQETFDRWVQTGVI